MLVGLDNFTSYTVQVDAFTIENGPAATAEGRTSENGVSLLNVTNINACEDINTHIISVCTGVDLGFVK